MNHQEAKDLLLTLLPEENLSLIKVEVFRLSWEGKGYNIISEESGYDHDYVRKAGSQLWQELSKLFLTSVTKRNFRPLLEQRLKDDKASFSKSLEFPGGAMLVSSPFYIERSLEESRAYNEISKPGSVVRIKGPRKMGKSSLMLRVMDQAESNGFKVVNIDFLKADRLILSDLDKLLRWICYQVDCQQSLNSDIDALWNDLIGSKLSASNYLQDVALQQSEVPVLLVINELNVLYDHEEVAKDFLPLLRSWNEESRHNESMQKLRQLLIYSTEAYVKLDINLSPFNIGLPIELDCFNGDQLERLAHAYGFNWRNDGNVKSPISLLLTTVGGHPYLTQLALYDLASRQGLVESPYNELKALLKCSTELGGLYEPFLQQLITDVKSNSDAVAGMQKITLGQLSDLSLIERHQLERLGIVSVQNGQVTTDQRLLTDYVIANI
ncbi:AAA-like domain-containing protein [Photobacterium makurazakiensis]|uniref:AAA-like domain-containing protein n=1 Tax=Photobacterium makurazakiensis TaxID=2910234 RepID=UPI003D124073